MAQGTLWLIPTALGGEPEEVIPRSVIERARTLRYFVAEDPKTTRSFLKRIGHPEPIASLRIERLNHHTKESDLAPLIAPLLAGTDAGLLSEAGCPVIADPGAGLVRLAHQSGIRVAPLAGPSSIVLALMASGLQAQRFTFHGYLPVKDMERARAIKALEDRSRLAEETEIFIEAPYRNRALLRALVSVCHPRTWLCVATDLTLPGESLVTRRIRAWPAEPPDIDRRPSVFLLLAE